jgi:hypothetical protein
MNKDLHDIDNLFKQSIDYHLEEVPPEVWQNIDHSLDKKQAAFYKRRYFTVRAAAIVLVLIGGVTIAAILRYRSNEKQPINGTVVTNASGSSGKANKNNTGKPVNKLGGQRQEATAQANVSSGEIETNKSVVKEENSKLYESTENSTYSADKNQEVSASGVAAKTHNGNDGVKVKPITTVPVYEGMNQKANLPAKPASVVASVNLSNDATTGIDRANFVGVKVLDVSGFTINNSVPASKSASSIVLPAGPIVSAPLSSTSKNGGSWSLSALYAQNMNLNTLKDDDHFRDPRNNSREAKRTEQETRSYSIGATVQKEFANRFGIQSGLQYFASQTTIKPKMIFAEPDHRGEVRYRFNCSSGESYLPSKAGMQPMIGDSIRTNSSESSLSYLQVPLVASYRISFGKVSLLPSAGIQTNFLLNGKLSSSLVQASGDEEVWTSIEGLRSMYFSGVIQPQLNYKMNERISFDLNPNINFSLSPINKETAVKTYQNMFSLGVGLRVKL